MRIVACSWMYRLLTIVCAYDGFLRIDEAHDLYPEQMTMTVVCL